MYVIFLSQICTQLVLFLGHWPLWSGCQLSSSVCEQHDSPSLGAELGPAVLNAPHVQLMRFSDSTLASLIELRALEPAGAAATTPGISIILFASVIIIPSGLHYKLDSWYYRFGHLLIHKNCNWIRQSKFRFLIRLSAHIFWSEFTYIFWTYLLSSVYFTDWNILCYTLYTTSPFALKRFSFSDRSSNIRSSSTSVTPRHRRQSLLGCFSSLLRPFHNHHWSAWTPRLTWHCRQP